MKKLIILTAAAMLCMTVCSFAQATKNPAASTSTKSFTTTIYKIDKVDNENYIIRVKIIKDGLSSEKEYKVTEKLIKGFSEKDCVKITVEIGKINKDEKIKSITKVEPKKENNKGSNKENNKDGNKDNKKKNEKEKK